MFSRTVQEGGKAVAALAAGSCEKDSGRNTRKGRVRPGDAPGVGRRRQDDNVQKELLSQPEGRKISVEGRILHSSHEKEKRGSFMEEFSQPNLEANQLRGLHN